MNELNNQISLKGAQRQNHYNRMAGFFKKSFKKGCTTPDLENSLIQLHLRKIWGTPINQKSNKTLFEIKTLRKCFGL